MALFNSEFEPLKKTMSSESISDEETGAALASIYHYYKYQADPHGAVGWLALNRWLEEHPDESGFFLETAHPVKFPEVVEKFSGHSVIVPESVSELFENRKSSQKLAMDYELFKKELLGIR
jgi:threonine synthase